MRPGVTAARRRRARPRRRPAIRVRDLRWGDFDDLTQAYWRLYDERDAGEQHGITLAAQKPTLSQEVEWFASLFRRTLDGSAIAVVAEVGGRVVGHCTINRVGRAPDSEDGHVGLLGILVERDHRGRGVGRALMRAALARARQRFEVVRLGVWANNLRAKRLYEHVGFHKVGVYPKAVRRRGVLQDEELMVIVLDRAKGHPTKR